MGKWRKVCTVATVALLAAFLLLSWYGSPLTRYQLGRQVESYLLEAGYQADDLAELAVQYDRREQNKYVVRVVFAAVPDAPRYYYCDDELHIQELRRTDD